MWFTKCKRLRQVFRGPEGSRRQQTHPVLELLKIEFLRRRQTASLLVMTKSSTGKTINRYKGLATSKFTDTLLSPEGGSSVNAPVVC